MAYSERVEAVVTSNGKRFDVNLTTTDEGKHVVNCDWGGIESCPFRHMNHSLQACVLGIPKLGTGVVLACGEVEQETI